MKYCNRCREIKSLDEFGKHKLHADGLQSHCRVCKSFTDKRYRDTNKEKIQEMQRIYRCKNRDVILDRHRKYYQDNRNECNKKSQRYYEVNRETVRKYKHHWLKQWRKKHPVEAALYTQNRLANLHGYISKQEWIALCESYNNHCLKCGKEEITMDHIVPLSRGGKHHIGNVQPLCKACNSSKATQIEDYRALDGEINVKVKI